MSSASLAGLNVLIIEDELMLRRQLAANLQRLGADAMTAETLTAGRKLAGELSFDFVMLDVNLPDGNGLDLLRQRVFADNTNVIVMTAEGGIHGAVEAMKLGAADYLAKPFEPEALSLVFARARKNRAAERAVEHSRRDTPELSFFFGSALAAMEAQLQKILTADRRMYEAGNPMPPVLIQGETGTGKTTIARWFHQNGPRANGPMVEMNCSAIPEHLAESELFGHEKGAFTDARSARMGLFEAANGGTLFLDELASLSAGLQAKLLTAIEDRRVRRVGASRDIPVDVRVIAAANRDLKQLVAEGRFREDLFHRLDLYRIHLPPLRDRGDDVLRLAESLVQRLCRRQRIPVKRLSEVGRRRLLAYQWPGNVRELSHEIERALVFDDGPELRFDQLMGVGVPDEPAPAPGSTQTTEVTAPLDPHHEWFKAGFRFPESGFSLEDAIMHLIRQALNQTDGNVSAAARVLGVSRDYLRYRLGPNR
jgi:two-component system, NtrC family, response regulator AtoC